jgi:hypothetical protein
LRVIGRAGLEGDDDATQIAVAGFLSLFWMFGETDVAARALAADEGNPQDAETGQPRPACRKSKASR